jgi:hypothetical protein
LAARALYAGLENPARVLQSAPPVGSEPRSTATGRTTDRSSSTGSTPRSGIPAPPRIRSGYLESSRGSASRSLPQPPALPFGSSTRTGTGRTPTDVLNRARSLDNPIDGQSKPATKGARNTRSSLPPAPRLPSLSPSDD